MNLLIAITFTIFNPDVKSPALVTDASEYWAGVVFGCVIAIVF
jgi:hypothetical protein